VNRWHPTPTLVRAALGSAPILLVAVGTGRPDLRVRGTPLLVHAGSRLLHTTLREGEGTIVRTGLDGAEDAEHVVVAVAPREWTATKPPSGVCSATQQGPSVVLDLPLVSIRWGRRSVGGGLVAASSAWAGYQWGPAEILPTTLTTLPLPGRFDSVVAAPHPIGLVGTHPARRPGEGSEFASIRPFAPGDRLRRLQWRVSLRTGTLHVTSTVAEEDSSVLLVVDSGVEIGESAGLGGSESSLDIAVRAAGAVAEHYLRKGDRVGLRVLGSTSLNAVHTGAGQRHLRRVLDTLARVVPGEMRDADPARMRFRVSAGSVVVMFSSMLSAQSVVATTALAQRGLTIVVVDTLPEDPVLDLDDDRLPLAWRMRRLERDDLLTRVQAAGIPVVAWRGPGTLDDVLRRLARRASRPTLARR
jgi:uncharacterized protein (DUF58 family)